MKKIVLGIVPSLAIGIFAVSFLGDRNFFGKGDMASIIYVPLVLAFIAWLIGTLVLKIQNISMRIIIIIFITITGIFSFYIFESNCNLRNHPNSCYEHKAQATGNISYCKMVGYQAGIDECQKEVALNYGNIRLCEGIKSVPIYNWCTQYIDSRQNNLPRVINK